MTSLKVSIYPRNVNWNFATGQVDPNQTELERRLV